MTQFVESAVKMYRNFGLRTTAIVESAHHKLKSYFANRFADLFDLQLYIRNMLLNRRELLEERFQK
jgi:hypothetical protein